MTITIIKRNQIITIEKVALRGVSESVTAYFYRVLPFYYRSLKARADVDMILATAHTDFVSFIREAQI